MFIQGVKAYYFEILLYIFFSIVLLLIIFLTRLLIKRAMIIPVKLFHDALQKENDGRFEEAEMGYRSALDIVKSKRFQSNKLKNAIAEKLKVLNTVIEYRKMSNANL